MRASPLAVVASFAVSLAACDEPYQPVIVEGEGDVVAEGEGEANEGEGEGEDGVVEGSCAALEDAEFGEAIALVTPRSRHSASLLADGRVMLIGGEDDLFTQSAATEFVDAAAGTAVAGPNLVEARYEHASVTLKNGHVVVAGGFGPGGHLTSIEVFDGTSFTKVGDLDQARAGLSGFVIDDKAVFFGGDNTEAIPRTVVSVDENNVVSVVAGVDIGENRRLHAATQRGDGSIVVVGGFFTAAIDSAISFDLNTANNLPRIAGARRQAAAGVIDGGVVAVAGLGTNGFLNDIELLGANAWTLTSRLRVPRASPEVAAVAGCLAVCGGIAGDPTAPDATDSCEGIDGAGHTVAMAPLPTATFSFSMTPLDEAGALGVLVAGGTTDAGHIGDARVLR